MLPQQEDISDKYMLTKDENIVDVTISAQYRISNLKDFVINVKDPKEA